MRLIRLRQTKARRFTLAGHFRSYFSVGSADPRVISRDLFTRTFIERHGSQRLIFPDLGNLVRTIACRLGLRAVRVVALARTALALADISRDTGSAAM